MRAKLSGPAFPEGAVEISELEGLEAIGKLFEFEIEVVCRDARGLDESRVVSHPAELRFEGDEGTARRLFGMVSEIRETTTHHGAEHPAYRLHLVPRAWQLTLSKTSEVFLDLSVPDIIQRKLEAHGLSAHADFEFRLVHAYQIREFVLQYAESDFDFCARLAEHLGISFFFEHRGGRDVIVFADSNDGFHDIDNDKRVPYLPDSGARRVGRIKGRMRAVPRAYAVNDYNYRTPTVSLRSSAPVATDGLGAVTEFGAHFKTPQEANHIAAVRAQELAAQRWVLSGESTVPELAAAHTFALSDHPRRDGEYLVTETRHAAKQATFLHGGHDGEDRYLNEFCAIPRATTFRPERRSKKPRIFGAVSGIIEAEQPGEYAELDEHGRYHVRFPFDTSKSARGKATHLIRMAQPHAGPGYGFHFPLRDGVEVLLTFIDGDPDRPVISGAVPNPLTPSTVSSQNATRNVIRFGGGSEINVDDTEGSERLKITVPFANTLLQLGAPNQPTAGFVLKTDKNGNVNVGKHAVFKAGISETHLPANNYTLKTNWIDVHGAIKIRFGSPLVETNASTIKETSSKHFIKTSELRIDGGHVHVVASTIHLSAGASTIKMSGGEIAINSPLIKLNC